LLSKSLYEELFLRYSESSFDEKILREKKDYYLNAKLEKNFDNYVTYSFLAQKIQKDTKKFYKEIWVSNDLRIANSNFYQLGFLKSTRGIVLLSIIDFYWTEHIERMGYIRETINWRSYGQQNPLVEYNIEAFKSFKVMFEQIRSCMLYYFFNNPINY